MTAALALPESSLPGSEAAWLVTTGLLSLRIASTFLMTPIFYVPALPGSVRSLMLLSIAVAMAAGMQPSAVAFGSPGALLLAALSELALGATLGLGILLAFGAISVAGQLLDVQLGFGMAQVLDPATRRPTPILTTAFNYVAVLVFFTLNGHHALLRGLRLSVDRFAVGMFWSLPLASSAVLKQAGGLFTLGFALAAPVVFCILLVEFVLGVIGRNLPQMNMFAIGIPVKVVVGLVALSMWFTGMGGAMTRIYAGITTTWEQIFTDATPAAGSGTATGQGR